MSFNRAQRRKNEKAVTNRLLIAMESRIKEQETQNKELLQAVGGLLQLTGGEAVLSQDFATKLRDLKLETSVNDEGNIVLKLVEDSSETTATIE